VTLRVRFAAARQRFDGWLVEYFRRSRKLFLQNPKALLDYTVRLGKAFFSDPMGLPTRMPPFHAVMSQTFRTFMRGWPVVIGFAVVTGLGLGAVADKFGVVLLPLIEQTILLTVVRDATALVLAVFLAARTGASIASRLADDRQTEPPPSGKYDSAQILRLTLPHLVASTVTGWAFYRIAVVFVIAGFRSMGDPATFWREIWGGEGFALDTELALGQANWWGGLKGAVYGFLIAYTASALGIATSEHRSFGRQRAIDVQNTVWESAVTALFLCMLMAALFWQLQPGST
jgi:ABC-type transporter Mla maintaining outer membrane lipid asymmetry permease subunit MlaE